jgi:hypothetical protein
MWKRFTPFLALAVISCVYPSAVMQMGPDTYSVVGTSEFGYGSAKEVAMKEANKFAAGKGLSILVLNDRHASNSDAARSMSGVMHTVEIVFRLVSQNDPEYQRPNYRSEPNVVIENRLPPQPSQASKPSPQETPATRPNTEKYDQLLKLKKLLDEKIITEDEYKTEKAKILGQ